MTIVALYVSGHKLGVVAAWSRDTGVPLLLRHRRIKAKGPMIGDGFCYTGEVSRWSGGKISRSQNYPVRSLRRYIAVVRRRDELVFQLRWGPFPVINDSEYKRIMRNDYASS